MIRIALVDDQQLVRQGIAGLIALSDDASICWQASNGAEALERQANLKADIWLLDIRMPELNGIETLKQLRASGDDTPVLMLTTFDDQQLFIDSMQAGANGFLLKDVSLDKLLRAVETVAEGGFLAEPIVLKQLSQDVANFYQGEVSAPQLTDKEVNILRLIAGGYSNREIANTVFLAEGTVKNHVSTILAKMECRDRTRAVLKALHLGLI